MRGVIGVLLIALSLVIATTAQAGVVDLLAGGNGSFEVVDGRIGLVNGNALNALGSSAKTWDVYDSLPGVWNTGAGPGIEVQYTGTVVPAQDGDHYVELDSDSSNTDATNSFMFHDLFAPTGYSDFLLSFWYRPRTDTANDNIIAVIMNEDTGSPVQIINEVTSNANYWALYNIPISSYVTPGSNFSIGFQAQGLENRLGGFIDNVHVYAETPEPGTMLLFGSAAGLIGYLRRRRSRKKAA